MGVGSTPQFAGTLSTATAPTSAARRRRCSRRSRASAVMPRMKPPYPVEVGFRGKPTLIQNVESIACMPAILERGGEWFKQAGRTEPGTKLYCLSGHVERPGVYEAPMGTPLRESAGAGRRCHRQLSRPSHRVAPRAAFLPAEQIDLPMDFAIAPRGGQHARLTPASWCVQRHHRHGASAALTQAVFFEDESCGQCSPCRIGTQIVRQALERYRSGRRSGSGLCPRGGLGDARSQHLRTGTGLPRSAADQRHEVLPAGVRSGRS